MKKNETKSFLRETLEAHVPFRSLCVRVEQENQNQAQYLIDVCHSLRGFRWTACATVGAAQLLHEFGIDVPVSGDAGLVWVGGGAA